MFVTGLFTIGVWNLPGRFCKVIDGLVNDFDLVGYNKEYVEWDTLESAGEVLHPGRE